MAEPRPTSRGWYLVAVGLIGCALALAITGFVQMHDTVAGMQRALMPGRADITLAPGRTTIYLEHHSQIRGTVYDSPRDLAIECVLLDPDHHRIALEPANGRVTYTTSDYAGRNVFDTLASAPGTYSLECRGPQPFVVAIGGGVGSWIVVAIVGGLLPGLAGIGVIVFVALRRRRRRR